MKKEAGTSSHTLKMSRPYLIGICVLFFFYLTAHPRKAFHPFSVRQVRGPVSHDLLVVHHLLYVHEIILLVKKARCLGLITNRGCAQAVTVRSMPVLHVQYHQLIITAMGRVDLRGINLLPEFLSFRIQSHDHINRILLGIVVSSVYIDRFPGLRTGIRHQGIRSEHTLLPACTDAGHNFLFKSFFALFCPLCFTPLLPWIYTCAVYCPYTHSLFPSFLSVFSSEPASLHSTVFTCYSVIPLYRFILLLYYSILLLPGHFVTPSSVPFLYKIRINLTESFIEQTLF